MSSAMMIQRLKQPVALRLLLQVIPDHFQAAACCPGYRHTISSLSKRKSNLSVHADRRWILTSLPCSNMQLNNVIQHTFSASQTCSTHILCGHKCGTYLNRPDRQTFPQVAVVGLTETPQGQVSALHRQTERQTRSLPLPQAFVASAPPSLQPYMKLVRWDRPIGNWLLFLPCTWSISLAAPAGQLPDLQVLALFGLGAVLMRGAGCTINDMWDKDFDKKVERTRDRPIACGDITRPQALAFLAVQLSASLAVLLSFDWYTVALGASCLGLVVTYPLMKRITYWPQLFLGLTLNWGVLISWSAVHGGGMALPGITLYLSTAVWSMIYDSVYSHQDKKDDIMVGVKSTALMFGNNSKYWLSSFAVTMVTGLAVTGHLCDQTWPYFAGVTLVAGHLAHQIYSVDLNKPEDCLKTFKSNRNLGLMFWAIIVAANLLKKPAKDEEEEEVVVST